MKVQEIVRSKWKDHYFSFVHFTFYHDRVRKKKLSNVGKETRFITVGKIEISLIAYRYKNVLRRVVARKSNRNAAIALVYIMVALGSSATVNADQLAA